MLYPTNGARLYIADLPAKWPGSLPVGGWAEVGETEALGSLGISWEMSEADIASVNGAPGSNVIMQVKQSRRALPMQILMGHDPEDEGQQIMRRAALSEDHYPFRLELPSGDTRSWFAMVVALSDVFDSANSVVKLQADLIPHHNPVEIG